MIESDICSALLNEFHENLPSDTDILLDYLASWYRKYHNDHCYSRLVDSITRILLNRMNNGEIQYFFSQVHDPLPALEFFLHQAKEYLQEKNFEKAGILLADLLIQAGGQLPGSLTKDYLSFRDFIEYAYYLAYVRDDDDRRLIPYLPVDILVHNAILLREIGDYQEAEKTLSELTLCSPVNSFIFLELAEINRITSHRDLFWNNTLLSFKFAWKREDLARTYRNAGYYLTETGDYAGAVTCYLMSRTWEESPDVTREISYITSLTGEMPDIEHFLKEGKNILASRNIPFGPGEEMIDLMLDYAEETIRENDLFEARKYLIMAQELTYRDDIEEKLEQIEKIIEDSVDF